MTTMEIILKAIPTEKVFGDYIIHGIPNRMPDHALFLAPEAADSFLAELAPVMGVSDMLRTAESSLHAVETGRGAQPPGWSNHGVGRAIDGMTARAMKLLGLKSKAELDAWMEARGWFCCRRDHLLESEEWHFNYFGVGYQIDPSVHFTAGYVEAEIKRRYEPAFQAMLADPRAQQTALAQLGMYGGDVDGVIGPQSKRGVVCFQKAWDLPANGLVDYRTARTLAFVTAKKTVVV